VTDFSRLIEHAFPLKETSLDSVHEKNVRHGHISTLHIWPARRPLAACRAALIATLLPDPGDSEKRKELCEKIAGTLVKKTEKKKMPNGQIVERIKEETVGGILHWGREKENAETLEWFRQEIRKAYGGRAPKVLDPFAGGGAIPLEAMRLGCEATAVDINPVAWFILKCTLEYPQKLAGQMRPLPDFILHDDVFMADFFKKAKGYGKAETKAAIKRLHDRLNKKPKQSQKLDQTSLQFSQEDDSDVNELVADLAWHVRAWGQWVLDRARRQLAQYYPTYADFEPIKKDQIAYEHQPMRLVPLQDDGNADVSVLNAEFTQEYLDDKRNPRWVAKPTVAYLWTRTVTCKNCRATLPLLKTRWLSKESNKRVLLTLEPRTDGTGVVFGVNANVPAKGGNAAQRREHDKRISAGTMSRSGAKCPCCPAIMTMEDLRVEGKAGNIGSTMTVAVVESQSGKAYRIPTAVDLEKAIASHEQIAAAFTGVPFGVPDEPMPSPDALGMRIPLYGFDRWDKLFTPRQLIALGTLVAATRASRESLASMNYPTCFSEAIGSYLGIVVGRTANYLSTICLWDSAAEEVKQTFLRFALPMTWDFAEANPMSAVDRYYAGGLSKVVRVLNELLPAAAEMPAPTATNESAIKSRSSGFDIIVTDPPYYDAIPYSDLMDFFYIWLRRSLYGLSADFNLAYSEPLSPKWNHESNDGELIDESSRHGNSKATSRQVYEDGMARAFVSCAEALNPNGRLVIVFANKQPAAWETLVSALIRAGFVVDGSWPIATEMRGGIRNFARASLASSVWLVCKKRAVTARPGWDNIVLEEMRANIAIKLQGFWDAGIRGPDFVWAATGPAMEAYSKHPVVRKANEPNSTMGVGEFLNHVRRMVVDYVVGQVLTGEQGADMAAADRLDEVTAYYLLHRRYFGIDDAPIGACILYATACGLSDTELDKTWNILSRTGGESVSTDESDEIDESDDSDGDVDNTEDTGSGSKLKLKPWNQRRAKAMGHEAPEGKAVPLIDRIHRVMHLWKDGDVQKVDEFLDQHALRRNELFKRVIQSLIELAREQKQQEELIQLERISNHVGAKGAIRDRGPELPFGEDELT
jgi:putative DNA methylase